jgi:hypothetical protein
VLHLHIASFELSLSTDFCIAIIAAARLLLRERRSTRRR